MKERFLYQKPRHDGDPGSVYHWTPTLAKKRGFVEITAAQAKRLRAGEDYRLVTAPTDPATGRPELPADHTLMAVPNSLVKKVRRMIDDLGKPEEIVVAPNAPGADSEFDGVPELVGEQDAEDEGPNLRPVEVVKIERARTKNAVEDLAAEYFPDEAERPALERSQTLDEMKQAVVDALQARILAEAEG